MRTQYHLSFYSFSTRVLASIRSLSLSLFWGARVVRSAINPDGTQAVEPMTDDHASPNRRYGNLLPRPARLSTGMRGPDQHEHLDHLIFRGENQTLQRDNAFAVFNHTAIEIIRLHYLDTTLLSGIFQWQRCYYQS